MAKAIQDKINFITTNDVFCYVVMSFSLKNAGATYQPLMDKVFSSQIGKNVEIYVDDIFVKSARATDLVLNLDQTLTTTWGYRLKLNLKKCIFRVRKNKFLGYIVTKRRIKANLREGRGHLEYAISQKHLGGSNY